MHSSFLNGRVMHPRFLAFPALVALFLACSSDSTSGLRPGSAAFDIVVSGETFRVQVATEQQAAALRAHMNSGRVGVISGDLETGNGGFNGQWSWHLKAASIHAPDVAIELCDGRPSMIEADLPYWLNSVKRYCPWGARVVGEVLQ
jgi:hypothetical protein